MSAGLTKLTLGVLYIAVALLVAVPPLYVLMSSEPCALPSCTMTSRQYFTADKALFWLLPFSIAAVLLACAFRMKSRR